jgi:hypothetical protein
VKQEQALETNRAGFPQQLSDLSKLPSFSETQFHSTYYEINKLSY